MVEKWEQYISDIKEKGNAFTGHGKNLKFFSEGYSQNEMILYCLVKIKGITDNKNYQIQYKTPVVILDETGIELPAQDLLKQAEELLFSK